MEKDIKDSNSKNNVEDIQLVNNKIKTNNLEENYVMQWTVTVKIPIII